MEKRTTPATKQGQPKKNAHILTLSPKQKRAVNALAESPKSREQMDAITGSSNSPDIIFQLKKKGYVIPCELMPVRNSFGEPTQAGRYCLVSVPRIKIGGKA